MNSGSRLIRSIEKLLMTRSIQGNVSANTPKMAAARGMNASTLSWIDVTVWKRLTSTPASRPASSIGRLTRMAVSSACRTTPTTRASDIRELLGEAAHERADEQVPAVDHHEQQHLERQRDHRRRQLHHPHRQQRRRDDQIDQQERDKEEEPHLEAGLQLRDDICGDHDAQRQFRWRLRDRHL